MNFRLIPIKRNGEKRETYHGNCAICGDIWFPILIKGVHPSCEDIVLKKGEKR